MTADLAEFVTARLAEDNLLALASCTGSDDREWTAEPEGMFEGRILDSRGETVVYDEGSPTHAQAMHIARHDPARVLREVAAKRALLAAIERAEAASDAVDTIELGYGLRDELLGYMAAVYSGHADYRQEWKVG